jgi:hypothetical protein
VEAAMQVRTSSAEDGFTGRIPIWYKRLEAGAFQFPFAATGRKEIAAWALAVLLRGSI